MCRLLETPRNALSTLNLSGTTAFSPEAASRPGGGATIEALRALSIRRLCAALGSAHCGLAELRAPATR